MQVSLGEAKIYTARFTKDDFEPGSAYVIAADWNKAFQKIIYIKGEQCLLMLDVESNRLRAVDFEMFNEERDFDYYLGNITLLF